MRDRCNAGCCVAVPTGRCTTEAAGSKGFTGSLQDWAFVLLAAESAGAVSVPLLGPGQGPDVVRSTASNYDDSPNQVRGPVWAGVCGGGVWWVL